MWRKIIGNKLLVTKKMWKSLLRKELNLRKFKTSAFLVKHMTPLTLFLLTWMSIDCRKFARKLYFAKKNRPLGEKYFASSIRKHFTKHFSLFYFRKIPNSYFMFMTWIDDAKNKLQKFIFLLAVWNPMDNLMQSKLIKFANDIFVFLTPHYSNKKNSISVFFCWEARKTYLAYVG